MTVKGPGGAKVASRWDPGGSQVGWHQVRDQVNATSGSPLDHSQSGMDWTVPMPDCKRFSKVHWTHTLECSSSFVGGQCSFCGRLDGFSS